MSSDNDNESYNDDFIHTEGFICIWEHFQSSYIKKMNKYCKKRTDTMTNIIGTRIRKINEIFIDIFMCMPLGYIVYYHNSHD